MSIVNFDLKPAGQFVTYSLVGLFSAALDLSVLYIFIQIGANILVAITAAFFCGLAINLWLHARTTFESNLTTEVIVRYFIIAGMSYVLTLSLVFVFQYFGQSYLIGKIASLPLVAINGFLWGKHWVFKV